MEHRYSRRIPLDLNALIYKHGIPVAMGRIKNGCAHGVFVETDYQDIRELQKIELEVLFGHRMDEKHRCTVSALVVRKSDFGLGLELELLNERRARPLKEHIDQTRQDQHRLNHVLIANTEAQSAVWAVEPAEGIDSEPQVVGSRY